MQIWPINQEKTKHLFFSGWSGKGGYPKAWPKDPNIMRFEFLRQSVYHKYLDVMVMKRVVGYKPKDKFLGVKHACLSLQKDMERMSTLRGKTFQQTLNKTTRYTDLVDEVVRDSYDGKSKCNAWQIPIPRSQNEDNFGLHQNCHKLKATALLKEWIRVIHWAHLNCDAQLQ